MIWLTPGKLTFYNQTSNLWRLGPALKKLGIKYEIYEQKDGYKYVFYFPKDAKLIEDRNITDRYFNARSVIVELPDKAKIYFWNHIGFTDGSQLIVSIKYLKKNSSS